MSVRKMKRVLALLGSTAVLIAGGAAASLAQDSLPALSLPAGELTGTAAVKALGNDLPTIAAEYGKTAQELRQLLLRDKTLNVAANGRLLYKETKPRLSRGARASDSVNSGALYPLDQTFSLHSRPGAPKLLVLRFRGATIAGTYWNTVRRTATISAPAYDTDGRPASFSEAELTNIQQIWQRVAEDYAPFDVDVTTDDTLVASTPASTLATAVITRQSVVDRSAPGVAYVSTFGNPAYEPAFVAFDSFGGNGKYIAEAVSHELGHRLGLDHDGTWGSAYFGGQGTAPMRWSPIMGNSYQANVSQFSKGEYNRANNKQDDFMVMARFLRFRADDAGDGPGKAAAFPTTSTGGVSSGSIDGVLERVGDADLYAITAAAGPFTAAVAPAALSPNADLVLTLLDHAGTVVATDNPATALNAAISGTLAHGGSYYLKVSGTGYGSAASNGYSNYGSRGNYRLTASYPTSDATPPRAAITASTTAGPAPLTVNFSAAGSTPASAITGYAWDFGNGSTSSQSTASVRFEKAGRYTVQLKVNGAEHFANSTTTEIEVGKTFTAGVNLVRTANPDGTVSVTAYTGYSYIDSDGKTFSPNTIYGSWSGAVSAAVTGTALNRSGRNFTSPAVRNANACFTFTINKVEYADTTTPATEQSDRRPMVYYPASPLTATSCPAQQASR